VRVAIEKVDGIESVEVSLVKAVTDIRLRPGNTVTLEQVRGIIRSSGFNAREATVTASGRVFVKNDQLLVDLAPARALLTIQPGAAGGAAAEARTFAGSSAQDVEVRGVIRAGNAISLTSIARRDIVSLMRDPSRRDATGESRSVPLSGPLTR
jgi:hypothetical protein